jgi:micrococcal nuclease
MYEYNADITSVYDGDTCTATIDLGFKLFTRKAKLRLLGIDTYELRSSDLCEKMLARDGRDYLRQLVLKKTVRIKSERKGKYGRYLVTIWLLDDSGAVVEPSVNQMMLDAEHARPYNR